MAQDRQDPKKKHAASRPTASLSSLARTGRLTDILLYICTTTTTTTTIITTTTTTNNKNNNGNDNDNDDNSNDNSNTSNSNNRKGLQLDAPQTIISLTHLRNNMSVRCCLLVSLDVSDVSNDSGFCPGLLLPMLA